MPPDGGVAVEGERDCQPGAVMRLVQHRHFRAKLRAKILSLIPICLLAENPRLVAESDCPPPLFDIFGRFRGS